MPPVLLVALGGAAGAVLRYLVARAVGAAAFPWATLCVNVAGCFGIGLAWLQRASAAGTVAPERAADLRLFVVVGPLGGLTTFSAFGQETVALLRSGALGSVAGSIVLNVALGLAPSCSGRGWRADSARSGSWAAGRGSLRPGFSLGACICHENC